MQQAVAYYCWRCQRQPDGDDVVIVHDSLGHRVPCCRTCANERFDKRKAEALQVARAFSTKHSDGRIQVFDSEPGRYVVRVVFGSDMRVCDWTVLFDTVALAVRLDAVPASL